MGGLGALVPGVCGLLIAGVAWAEPAATELDAAEVEAAPGRLRIDLVGFGVIETRPAALELGADGVRQRSPVDEEDDSFPDAVLVGNDQRFYCTGVLIDPRHVLTAGHCAEATRVGLGHTIAVAIHVAVRARRRHPRLDVAVLTLARPAEVRIHPRRRATEADPPLGALRFLGFGVKDHLRLTGFGTKRQVDLAVDGWGCTRARAEDVGCAPDSELVVIGQGNDTCLGDSGGPVFERARDGWRLVAITSRGMRPRKVICGEGGIYVRVDRIAGWLNEEVRR